MLINNPRTHQGSTESGLSFSNDMMRSSSSCWLLFRLRPDELRCPACFRRIVRAHAEHPIGSTYRVLTDSSRASIVVPLNGLEQQQDRQRGGEQNKGDGRGASDIVLVQAVDDEERGDLGFHR